MSVQPVRTITESAATAEAPDGIAGQVYLQRSLQQFEAVLAHRLRGHIQQDADPEAPAPAFDPPAPHDDAPYSHFVREQRLDRESQLLLLLAFAPWIRPDFFDR